MSFLQKFFLGSAEFSFFLVEILIRLHLLKYCTDILNLKPFLASIAISVGLFWDAISDPLMGYISDKYSIKIKAYNKTFVKRRVFYILFGGFFLGIFISLLFNPFLKESSDLIKFLFILIVYFLTNTFLTITSVPHSALCAESTIDPNDRNLIFGFRLFWGNLGLIFGILIPQFLLYNEIQIQNYFLLFFIILFFNFLSFIIGFSLDNKNESKTQNLLLNSYNLKKNIKFIYKNPYFLILLVGLFIGYIGIGINSNFALYYYEYYLKLEQNQIALVLVIFLLFWTFSIPLWIYLSRFFDKKNLVFLSICLLGIENYFYSFFPEKNIIIPLIGAIIGGILLGSIPLLDSLVADLVDYDFVKTRTKKEGLYFGILKMIIKLSRTFAILLSGFLLDLIQFDNQNITFEISKKIAYIFGILVGSIFILSSLFIFLFQYDKKKHKKVNLILNKHQKRLILNSN